MGDPFDRFDTIDFQTIVLLTADYFRRRNSRLDPPQMASASVEGSGTAVVP